MFSTRLAAPALFTLSIAACTPAPATPTPIVHEPAAPPKPIVAEPVIAAPVVPPKPAAAPEPTPAGTGLPWQTLADGVVPRAVFRDVTLAEATEAPVLDRARKCAARGQADCNYGPGILGFGPKGVALSYSPESGMPEIWPVVGEIVSLAGESVERKEITRSGELEGKEYTDAIRKGWKYFARIAEAGYTAPAPLIWSLALIEQDNDTPHEPLAFLKAPLAGWMLYITPPIDDEKLVQLVAPDNKRAYTLASLPVENAAHCLDEGGSVGACPTPQRYERAQIVDVALDPSATKLVVLYTLYNPPGRVDSTRWAVYELPPEIQPKQ